MSKPPKPRALLFDWDNTVVDTWPVIHDANNTVLEAMGHRPWTMAETRRRVRKSMRDAYPELFGERWEEAGRIFYERFKEIHLEALRVVEDMDRVIREIHGLGHYLAVISNKNGDYLRAECAALGLESCFERIVGATDAERDKPAPEAVDLALSEAGIEKGRHVWFIGDTEIDMECAHLSGLLPVLVRNKAPENSEFSPFDPELHFINGQALLNYLKTHYH